MNEIMGVEGHMFDELWSMFFLRKHILKFVNFKRRGYFFQRKEIDSDGVRIQQKPSGKSKGESYRNFF